MKTETIKKIKLGVTARDVITGFEGIVIGRTEYLYGCAHIAIKSTKLDKDGAPMECKWFDEPQVEMVPKKAKIKPVSQNTGGPKEIPMGSHG